MQNAGTRKGTMWIHVIINLLGLYFFSALELYYHMFIFVIILVFLKKLLSFYHGWEVTFSFGFFIIIIFLMIMITEVVVLLVLTYFFFYPRSTSSFTKDSCSVRLFCLKKVQRCMKKA